jgi:hypothetical protein
MKNKIKLLSVKPLKSGQKKYVAEFEITTKDGKKRKRSTKFGAKGMSDYTIHKDIERRNRYIKRHTKDLRTNDPTRAGFLSMYVLWNKKTFKASLSDYKRRLNTYNKTGKFPKSIPGSSLKSKFGNYEKFTNSSLIKNINNYFDYNYNNNFGKIKQKLKKNKVPDNVKNPKLYLKIKTKIQKDVKAKKRRWGAYDSGRLVREYKQAGGKYSGSKKSKTCSNKSSNLDRWYKEKWIDACAWPKRKSCGRTKASIKSNVTYCRPSKIIDSNTPKTVQELTKAQIKKRCAKKSKNPKKIIRK